MTETVAPLGFQIDTAALRAAAEEALRAAQQVGKFGDKVDQLAAKSKIAAGEQQKHAGATKEQAAAAQSATGHLSSMSMAAQLMAAKLGATNAIVNQLTGALGIGNGLTGVGGQAVSMIGRFAGALGPVGLVAGAVVGAVAGLVAGYYAMNSALASSQDRMAQFEARLKNTYKDMSLVPGLMASIRDIALETGQSFNVTTDSFLRLSRTRDAIGASRKEMLELTEAVQKLGIVSGASTGEVASGMLQLSQALASGRLNGDELRSIMENMPALAKAIADGLGVSVGQIRSMGAAGELTSEKIFGAILKALPSVRDEFKNLPNTVERSSQRMTDAWERFKAALGKRIDASQFIQSVVEAGTAAINKLANMARERTVEEKLRDAQEAVARATPGTYLEGVPVDRTPYGGAATASTLPSPSAYNAAKAREQVALLEDRLNAQRLAEQSAATAEANSKFSAAILTANSRLATEDEFASKQKEVKSTTEALTAAIDALQKGFTDLNPGDAAAKLAYFQAALFGASEKAKQAQDAVTKFKRESGEQAADYAKYGGGAGQAIGSDVRKLQSTFATENKGQLAEQEALLLVLQRRKQAAVEQVDATNRQVAAQQRLSAATGVSRSAEREAEVQNKAIDMAYQQFGKTLSANDPIVRQYAAALRALNRSQDVGVVNDSLRSVKEATQYSQAQLEAEKLIGREREVALAMAEQENALRQKGVILTDSQREAMKGVVSAQAEVNDQLRRQRIVAHEYEKIWTVASDGIRSSIVDSFDVAFDRSVNKAQWFTNTVSSMMRNIAKQIANAALAGPIDQMVSGLKGNGGFLRSLASAFGAGGGGFADPSGGGMIVTPAAMGAAFGSSGRMNHLALGGSVFDRPTIFPMANGGSVAVGDGSEPEGVFPLKRAANGRMGIDASGAGGGDVLVTVNDMRTSQGSEPVQVSSKKGPDGRKMISIMVRDEVKGAIRAGALDKDLRANYGNTRTIKRV